MARFAKALKNLVGALPFNLLPIESFKLALRIVNPL